MTKLDVVVTQQAAVITDNFSDIKKYLKNEMSQYSGLQYTDDNIVLARRDVANLRKVIKALDAKRKEVKKTHMIPYNEFEKQAKELIKIIEDTINPIDVQIKEYEEQKRQEKAEKIQEYFDSKVGDLQICLEDIWDNKWITNMATSMRSIREAIDEYIDRMQREKEKKEKDIQTIRSFCSDVEERALAAYERTRNLSDAIIIIHEHEQMKAEIIRREEERRRIEEEQKRQAELERVQREEMERVQREEEERKKIAEEAERKAREEERKAREEERKAREAEPKNKPVNFVRDLDELPEIEEDIPVTEEILKPLDILVECKTLQQKIIDIIVDAGVPNKTAQIIAEKIIKIL